MCYYFLRTNNETSITQSNISTEVNFGMLDCSRGELLQGLEGMLSKVMLPVLQSQEVCALGSFTRCLGSR